jgi:hypothetical protein
MNVLDCRWQERILLGRERMEIFGEIDDILHVDIGQLNGTPSLAFLFEQFVGC